MIRSASGSASFFLALRLFPCKASFNGTNSPDDSEESFVSLSSASSNNSWSCSKQFMKSSEFSGASSSNKSLSSESSSSDGPKMCIRDRCLMAQKLSRVHLCPASYRHREISKSCAILTPFSGFRIYNMEEMKDECG